MSQFITANRGGSEEFKLEYEGTFVLSTLTEEQKTAQADLLTTLTTNPEQSMMLPDHVEGKTTYFTAARMDNEGNLKYEIRSFTQKEEEKEEQPIDKVEGTKLEEATLNLELSIDIDKQEEVDKETLIGQSLLTEIEAVSEEDAEQTEEITQSEEQSFSIPEVQHADVEQVISVEETQSDLTPVGEYANIDNTHYGEQVVIEAKEDTEKAITEKIIDLLKDEPQTEFIEEASTVVNVTETEQSLKDTHEYIEPLVVTVEDKTEKVLTLEDRIRELFRDEVEPTEIVSEQVQTFEVQNVQQEEIVADVNKTTEINTATEIVAEAEITLPYTHNTEMNKPVVNETLNTTIERSAISNEQEEQVVDNAEDVENQAEIHETVQVTHIENIQEQNIELVEQTFVIEEIEVDVVEEKPEEVVIVNEQESKISSTTEQVITKEVNANVEVGKSEYVTVEQDHVEEINIVVKNNEDKNIASQEVSKTEPILSEVVNETHVVEVKEIKSESNVAQEAIVNNIQPQSIEKIEAVPHVVNVDRNETQNIRSVSVENSRKDEKADQHKESPSVVKGEEKRLVETKEKDIKVANTREIKVVAKEATPEKAQVLNAKPEKEVKNNVLPFKTKENKDNQKNVEVKSTKPVIVEKIDTKKEVNKLSTTNKEKVVAKNQEERTPKSSREAIVLTINRSKVTNTTRNEVPISLEKPREEQRTREESVKAKPLDGHEILLQILGLSQNGAEVRNAEPSNSRSVPNTNQEEQENKSTKLISSIYQRSNLNGITLKIAA